MRNSPLATLGGHQSGAARLGFAVMVGKDGHIPEALLIGLKEAGYNGIEPNCSQPSHVRPIVELCRNVGLAIHALPAGRWMQVADDFEDYDQYTKHVLMVVDEGAKIAVALDVPLIFGLIRGRASIPDAAAEKFICSVVASLMRTAPPLKVLVEPIAPSEAAWPPTMEQGAQLLKRLNLANVKLLADSYHVARSGEDPWVERYRTWIGHLHIQDSEKQIPTTSTPPYATLYASSVRLWREENLVLSFEPNIELSGTLENAIARANWVKQAQT